MPPSRKFGMSLRYFFLAFFIFLLIPPFFYNSPQEGLDNSWNIAIDLAYKYNLQFGKDFVFTYGPLGFLNARLPISINLFVYLVFDIFFLFNLFIILKEVFKEHFNYGSVLFIFLSIMLAQYGGIYQWYFFFFYFFLFSFLKTPGRKDYLFYAALLSVLSFYFKVSLGISAVFIFLLAVHYALLRKKINVKPYALILSSYFACIWLGSRLLHVNLKGYLTASLRFIDGYNDAMFRTIDDKLVLYLYGAVLIILIIVCWIAYLLLTAIREGELARQFDRFFIYALIALGIFVLFKSSFVRSDTNLFLFFQYIGLFAVLLYLHGPSGLSRKIAASCCWFILIISAWAVNTIPPSYKPYLRVANLSFIPIKIGEIGNYLSQLGSYHRASADSDSLEFRDNKYKEVIGNRSVDIVPSEISRIYFNGLHYNPRPVIQSYAAFDKYLDGLNYQKYISAGAPDFILFSVESIDDRFPFFDETKTKMAILSHYEVAGGIGDDLLLRRRETPGNLRPSAPEDTVSVKLGEDVSIKKSNDLQYARILVGYSLWGRLRRFFYQPPSLKITLTLENGDQKTFRAIIPILADGVIINKFIQTKGDFQLLMQAGGRLSTNVRKFRIEAPSESNAFSPDIKLISTYYKLPEKTALERETDNLGVLKLLEEYDSYKPVPVDPAHYEEDSFRYGLGSINNSSALITIDGWAFREKDNNAHSQVKVVLRSGDKVYELPTWQQTRPDLTEVFQRDDLANAGFIARAGRSQLPSGDYQIGMVILNPGKPKKWIRYTDNHLQIKSEYRIEKLNSSDSGETGDKNIQYAIGSVKEDDDKIVVDGWAFIKNDSGGMATNLILRSKEASYRINTDMAQRIDVVNHFNNPLLLNSGFKAEISKDQLPAGIYTIGIEKVYSGGHKRSVIFTAESIKSGIPDIFIPVPVSVLPPTQDFDLGMDYVKDEGDLVSVSGWAIQKMQEVRNSTIGIVLKSDHAIFASGTEARSRPDVTAHFHNRLDLDNCGFFAKISKKPLPAGRYEVGIHVYQNGNAGTVKFIGAFIVKH